MRLEGPVAVPSEQHGERLADLEAGLERADDELLFAHEALERRERAEHRRALPLEPRDLETEHEGSRGRQRLVGGSHAVEARAVEGDVGASGEAHIDDVGAGARLAGVAAHVVVLVLPEDVRVEERLREHAVEQPRGQVGLLP